MRIWGTTTSRMILPPTTEEIRNARPLAAVLPQDVMTHVSFRILLSVRKHRQETTVPHRSDPRCSLTALPIGKWVTARSASESNLNFKSSNFKVHGHDPALCDCIVCWHHDCPTIPRRIEVIELKRFFGCHSKSGCVSRHEPMGSPS
jgi:hypothetical protein